MDILDVGCGPGTLTTDLAAKVTPGHTVGIDLSPDVIAQEQGADNVSFRVGDFHTADLGTASFDIVHAHQVLHHLNDPVSALETMARLTRPGGIVAARDADYSAMIWTPPNEYLDRWLAMILAVTRRNGGEPNAGRYLLRWAQQAHLRIISYTTSTWTFATPEARAWWADLWADRTVASAFAEQAVSYGIATPQELAEVAQGWRFWHNTMTACSSSCTGNSSHASPKRVFEKSSTVGSAERGFDSSRCRNRLGHIKRCSG